MGSTTAITEVLFLAKSSSRKELQAQPLTSPPPPNPLICLSAQNCKKVRLQFRFSKPQVMGHHLSSPGRSCLHSNCFSKSQQLSAFQLVTLGNFPSQWFAESAESLPRSIWKSFPPGWESARNFDTLVFHRNLSKSFFHIAVFIRQPCLYTAAPADVIIIKTWIEKAQVLLSKRSSAIFQQQKEILLGGRLGFRVDLSSLPIARDFLSNNFIIHALILFEDCLIKPLLTSFFSPLSIIFLLIFFLLFDPLNFWHCLISDFDCVVFHIFVNLFLLCLCLTIIPCPSSLLLLVSILAYNIYRFTYFVILSQLELIFTFSDSGKKSYLRTYSHKCPFTCLDFNDHYQLPFSWKLYEDFKIPVDEEPAAPFPSSSSITERFPPPGLQDFRRITSQYFQVVNLTEIQIESSNNIWDNLCRWELDGTEGMIMSIFLFCWPSLPSLSWCKVNISLSVWHWYQLSIPTIDNSYGGWYCWILPVAMHGVKIVACLLLLLLLLPRLEPGNVSTHLVNTLTHIRGVQLLILKSWMAKLFDFRLSQFYASSTSLNIKCEEKSFFSYDTTRNEKRELKRCCNSFAS